MKSLFATGSCLGSSSGIDLEPNMQFSKWSVMYYGKLMLLAMPVGMPTEGIAHISLR